MIGEKLHSKIECDFNTQVQTNPLLSWIYGICVFYAILEKSFQSKTPSELQIFENILTGTVDII